MTANAFIAVGSNIGDREGTLCEALRHISHIPQTEIAACSSLYETEPVGVTDQPLFLNGAVALRTSLEPEELLRELLRIELELGRERRIRWGPRTIDLDLILMDGVRRETEALTLPHPRMNEREFVLVPLLEVMELCGHPDAESVRTLLEKLDGKDERRKWNETNWPRGFAPSES